jgi:hypothetical protein
VFMQRSEAGQNVGPMQMVQPIGAISDRCARMYGACGVWLAGCVMCRGGYLARMCFLSSNSAFCMKSTSANISSLYGWMFGALNGDRRLHNCMKKCHIRVCGQIQF